MIDPMSGYPGYLLRRASGVAMGRLGAELARLSLRPTEATVLLVIDANQKATQSEIGKLLDIARANMAPLVSKLHKRGWIVRDRIDGRSHGLQLTSSGQKLVLRVRKAVSDHEKQLIERIPIAHREGFAEGVRALWRSYTLK